MAKIIQYKKKQKINSSFKSKLGSVFHSRNKTLLLIQIVCIIAVAVLIAFLLMYWGGNGFSTADNILGEKGDFYIRIDSPTPGSQFSQGNNIYIEGGSLGGQLSKAIIWDTQYNVGAPCSVSLTKFSYAIYPNHISLGKHTIAIQAQNVNGEWSQITYTDFEVKSGGLAAPSFPSTPPSTIPGLFQPVVDIWNGITGHVEQGQGDNDLNGDNVDDRLQTSPYTPRYNPFNLPVTMIIMVIMILIVIIIIAFLIMKYVRQRGEYKSQMTKYIAASPERRDWYLRLKTITAKTEPKASINNKIRILKRKEEDILQKQRTIKIVRVKPRISFGSIGRSIQSRLASIQNREKNIKQSHQAKMMESQLAQQLRVVRHNRQVAQLEDNKLALQNNLLRLKRSNSIGTGNYGWFAKRLARIETQQQQLNEQHRREMEMERMQRANERNRFVDILSRLETEKKDLGQQKAVKILIVPKGSERPKVPYNPFRQRPAQQQFIRRDNRGIAYGRRKKAKRKKTRKVAL